MIHPTAEVQGQVDASASVWQYTHVREGAIVGAETVLSRGAYVDHDVQIGARCKIGNYACVYWPALVADGVFIGPHALLINDKHPAAVNQDGTLKGVEDWEPRGVTVGPGASIGARSVIMAGVTIGAGAMIGAGAVVTHDVPAGETWVGVPATKLS